MGWLCRLCLLSFPSHVVYVIYAPPIVSWFVHRIGFMLFRSVCMVRACVCLPLIAQTLVMYCWVKYTLATALSPLSLPPPFSFILCPFLLLSTSLCSLLGPLPLPRSN